MSKYHRSEEIPKLGSKIEYALRFNDVNVSVYGEYNEMGLIPPYGWKVGLSDFTDWRDVLIWCYIDADYNYGSGLINQLEDRSK